MSAGFEKSDLADATLYAVQLYTQHMIQEYHEKLGVELTARKLDWDLKSKERLKFGSVLEPRLEFKYTKTGCGKLHCYSYMGNRKCTNEPLTTVNDGANVYEACQDICSKMKVPLSVIWSNNRCNLNNMILERYCLQPHVRTNSKVSYEKVPAYHYNRDNQTCTLSEVYCNKYGMTMRDGKCEESGGFKFSDFIFGRTITRTFSNSTYSSALSQWAKYENAPPFSSPTPYTNKIYRPIAPAKDKDDDDDSDYYDLGTTTTRTIMEIVKFILENLGIVVGVKGLTAIASYIATSLSEVTFERLLPTAIYEAAIAVSTAAEVLLTNEYVLWVTTALQTTVEAISTLLNPILIALLVVNFVGIIVDAIDPLHLHSELKTFTSPEILKKIETSLKQQYAYIFTGSRNYTGLIEVTPAITWSSNREKDEKNPERLKFILEKSSHYLLSLEYNALGQKINFDTSPKVHGLKIHTEPSVHKISKDIEDIIFQPPAIERKIIWSSLMVIIGVTGILFAFEMHFHYLIVLILAFCLFAFDLITWWTSNPTLTGNMLFIYDKIN